MKAFLTDRILSTKKKIICFGAGSYFKVMYYDFKARNVAFTVEGVIDNDANKHGNNITILGEQIQVLSIEDVVRKYNPKEIVIFITTTSYRSVLEQLEKYAFFNLVDYIPYFEIKKNETCVYDCLESKLLKPIIPKVIHYCWFGGCMPSHLQKQVDSWHEKYPDYDFVCWNKNNYDVSKNLYTQYAFENRKWGFVSDYARLDIIYQNGGIYLDTDVQLVGALDKLRCNEAFFGVELSGGINTGSGFGAIKGHKFIKEILNAYECIDINNPCEIMSGSGIEIDTFYRNGYVNNGKYQIINGVTIYPYQVLTAMIRETGECMRTNATVGIHHFEGSWC